MDELTNRQNDGQKKNPEKQGCHTSNVTHERKIVSSNMPTTELTNRCQGDRWTEGLLIWFSLE